MEPKEIPINDLDLAIMELVKSSEATPLFIKELVKGELWFMTRLLPKEDGQSETLVDGSPSPLVELRNKSGNFVAIYSSMESLDESFKALKITEGPISAAVMNARFLLGSLGAMELRTVVNKRCKTGEVELPNNLLRDIGAGKV